MYGVVEIGMRAMQSMLEYAMDAVMAVEGV